MLTLTNVGKLYATRRKRKIYGLQDVNLTFPDKGLCLILGKSGSGKTTLLNILGGLDAKYEGEYKFMNKKLAQKDFAELRQNHISFIFQSYNLIDDYSVAENVALGMQLSQNSACDVSAVLEQVGLGGYGERYPKELSGGQQQRVAIARALLKQSSLLLADEPTGNLDKENSVEIYNLLKEISKNKLVIVVSHDEELCLQYADYVVRLHKGKVINSNLPNTSHELEYTAGSSHVISNKQAFKMGAREITRKKGKNAFIVALMAVCFCVLSFTMVAVPLFKASDMHYKLIKDKGYEYVNITDVTYEEYLKLQNDGVEMIIGNDGYMVIDKEQAEALGFEFYDGVMPLEPNSYYVSDYSLRRLTLPNLFGQTNNKAIIDGEETVFSMDDIFKLVGQRINAYGYENVCAGIFKSDLEILADEFVQYSKPLDVNILSSTVYEYGSNNAQGVVATYDGKQVDISGKFEFEHFRKSTGKKLVLTNEGVAEIDNGFGAVLKENEVFVGLEMFNRIFQMQYNTNSLFDFQRQGAVEVKRIPPELGKSVNITTENGVTIDNLVIKGIVFSRFGNIIESESEIIFSDDNLDDRNLMVMTTRPFGVWVKTDTVKNLKRLLANHNHLFSKCDIFSPVSVYETELRNSFKTVQLSLLGVSLVLIVVTILMTNLLISGQITGQKRKIGIYKALGATNGDIQKIFLYEMILIAVPMIILAVLFTVTVTAVLNNIYVKDFSTELTLIYYHWVNIPITIFAVLAVLFAGIVAPLRKITRLNVIDAIKDNTPK